MAMMIGVQLRDARIGRRWTLRELAEHAGVAVASAHAAEAGRPVSLETYARLAAALGQRPALVFEPLRSPLNQRGARDVVHSAMGELEAAHLGARGFQIALDEPYQHFQFAGRADLVAWNLESRCLLHLENKSRLQDLQELAGSYNAKRAYLPSVMADRLGVGPAGWRTVTHALVVLWSSEVLHVLRTRAATLRALCPSPLDAFEAWWNGYALQPGVTSCLVILDPVRDVHGRRRHFVGVDLLETVRPRYRGYADAARVLGTA